MSTDMSTDMNTEQKAASTLLDRGVAWKVPAPWWMRLIGKKTLSLEVKAIRLSQLLELSGLYASMGIDPEQSKDDPHALIPHARTVCQIAAICLLSTPLKRRLFAKALARILVDRLTGDNLLEMMLFVVTYSGLESFTTTIRLIGEMRMTKPKNLSPENQGS